MSIRMKTLAVVILTLLGLLLTAFFVSYRILSQGFADLEQSEVQINVQRAINALGQESVAIDTLVFDWAAWDETYAFIENSNQDYIDSNLVDEMFANTPLNFIVYVSVSGKIVFAKAFDLDAGQQTPLPDDLLAHLRVDGTLLRHLDVESSIRGMLLLSSGPIIVASRPITSSDMSQPIRGAVIMGRYLDPDNLDRVASATQLDLSMYEVGDPDMPADFKDAWHVVSANPGIEVQPLNSGSVAGYSLVQDINGDPITMLRAVMPRAIYAQGEATARLLLLSLILIAVVYGLVIMWLLHRVILTRLAGLGSSAVTIGKSQQLSMRLPVTGNDELSDLARDINQMLGDLEAAEKAVLDLRKQLVQQERLRALGTMASGIAHDFNNALTPVLGYSDMLLEHPELLNDRDKATEFLQDINRAANDASQVVSRMRDYYRQPDEIVPMSFINLNEVIGDAIGATRPRWKDMAHDRGKVIEVETNLSGEPPIILGDEPALRSVLTNLILNAIEAMPDGGRLTLSSVVADGHAVMTVRDTGTGMTEEVRERAMEPFFTTKHEGSGLGLAMVHGTVERHGGTIDVQSVVGKGSTFVVTLPIAASPHDHPDPSPKENRTAIVSGLHVLVVDDEPIIVSLVTQYLINAGNIVTSAGNGEDALAKFTSERFDLVVTDRGMPQMNGDELAAAIRETGAETPIILLTGVGEMMEVAGEHPRGVNLILKKPVTERELVDAMSRVLG